MKAGSSKHKEVPWVEKYRPRCLDEVSHQEEVLKMLKKVCVSGNMPHLLFHGPPGTGKTSSILALAAELFGRDKRADRVKELNASDDRGIAAVREKVKDWSRYEPRGGGVHPTTGRPLPPWKIVILDEADMMTSDAQSALRRIIEDYSRSTRFVIICNYFHKIIDPLRSRCSVYRFQPISASAQIARLKKMCMEENVVLEDDQVLEVIHKASEGDLRRGITLLQSASRFGGVLDKDILHEVSGYPPITVAQSLVTAAETSCQEVEIAVRNVGDAGWDVCTILKQLAGLVTQHDKWSNVVKARILTCIAERNAAIVQGASDFLGLLSICSHMAVVLNSTTT